MNIRIIENINEIFEIVIKCPKTDASITKLKNHIEAFEKNLTLLMAISIITYRKADIWY